MCTVLVLHKLCVDYPLVVAANRDERFDRPATGAIRLRRSPIAVGGRDLVGGGSWMGVTGEGLLVALTNQRTYRLPDPRLRSRGELVTRALEEGAPEAVRRWLSTLDGRHYNPFNLLFGRSGALFVAYGRVSRAEIEVQPVSDGLHVLPNDRLDHPDLPKCARARRLLGEAAGASWTELEPSLRQCLADVTLPPIEEVPAPPDGSPFTMEMVHASSALCIQTPGYGTRSSSIVALSANAPCHYRYANGPPDRTPFEDVMGLFDLDQNPNIPV